MTLCNKSYELIVVVRKEELNNMSSNLLNNIIKAIKLPKESSYLTIQFKLEDPCHFSDLKCNYQFTKMIVFGLTPKDLGLNINTSLNKLLIFGDHTFLFTSSIEQIIEEQKQGKKQAKIQLWKAIQLLFKI